VFGLCVTSWRWNRCPEIRTSSIDWAHLSRLYLKTETESTLRNVVFWKINRTVFLDKERTMDNVQKHNICTNVPSSQTFTSCFPRRCLKMTGGYTDPQTLIWYDTDRIDNDAINNPSIVAYNRCGGNVFIQPLRSNDEGIHIQTHILMGGIYKIRHWGDSPAMIYIHQV
jgi:hypothetical protein